MTNNDQRTTEERRWRGVTAVTQSMFGAAVATAIFAVPATAQEIELKLHHFLGPKAPAHSQMLEPWAQRIEEASGGRVDIEIYPSMSLGGTPPELIRKVRDGVVDMVWTLNGYSPGLFPRTEVFELPQRTSLWRTCSIAIWRKSMWG